LNSSVPHITLTRATPYSIRVGGFLGASGSITTPAACTGSYNGDNSACNFPGNPVTCCRANFNQVNALEVQDIFDFLNAWFAGSSTADFNGGGLAVQDIFDFLNAWFAGC
jgi:hypothetical protein